MSLKKIIENKINVIEKKFSVIIGSSPSKGARSPKLWNKCYKDLDMNKKMYPLDIKDKNLKNFILFLKSKNCNIEGGSITIPFKEKFAKYVDYMSESSKKIGAVNTFKIKDQKIYASNTDYEAIVLELKKFKITNNSKILILGSGGVGKPALLAALNIFKKAQIYVYNRNYLKLFNFKKKIKKKFKIIKSNKDLLRLKNFSLVINSTSVGFDQWIKKKNKYFNLKFFSPLGPTNKIIPIESKNIQKYSKKNLFHILKNLKETNNFFIKNNQCRVLDLIYNPFETILMKFARKNRNSSYNGIEINKNQAIEGFAYVNSKIRKLKIKNSMK